MPGAHARPTGAPSRLLRTGRLPLLEGAARWRHPALSAALYGRAPPLARAFRPDDGQIRRARSATAPPVRVLLASVLRMPPAPLRSRLRKPLACRGRVGFFYGRLFWHCDKTDADRLSLRDRRQNLDRQIIRRERDEILDRSGLRGERQTPRYIFVRG